MGLIVLLSAVFFVVERMDYFGRDSISVLLDGERYYAGLTARLRGQSPEDIGQFLADEEQLLNDYSNYLFAAANGVDPTESMSASPEEVEAAAREHVYLSALKDMDDAAAHRRIDVAASRVQELRDEAKHIAGYADYLDNIQAQAERQAQTALFGKENSFTRRNLARTAEEFAALRGVKVEFGANRAFEGWIDYELADYLYLLVIVIFLFAFLEEREAGLWGVIRTCRGGRLPLGLQRAGILFCAAVLGTVLIYGVDLLCSLVLSGGWDDMGRSAQSLLELRTMTRRVTIGQWIVEYLLVKAASGFAVGLFLWCLLDVIFNVQFSLAVLLVPVAVEYSLFTFLPVQSILNPLKYINLFSYIRTSVLYTQYLNMDLLGWPVGVRQLALTGLPVLTILFFAWAMLLQHRRHPAEDRDILSAAAGAWDRWADRVRKHFTAGGWEIYKTMVFQWGLLILIVIFLTSGNQNYIRYSTGVDRDPDYEEYLEDIQGPLDGSLEDYFASARANAGGDGKLLSALDRVEAHVAEVRARAEAGGYEPWIVASQWYYESIYGENSRDLQRMNASAAIVFLILCCSGSWAFEQQSGVVLMVRSLRRGRGSVFAGKLLSAGLMTAFVWAMVYVREFLVFVRLFRTAELAAPVGNFDTMAGFPLNITMGQYLFLLYFLRFMMLYLLAMVILFVSRQVPTVELSLIFNFVLLGLPGVLFALGIDIFGFLSPVIPVSSAELLWGLRDRDVSCLVPWLIWLVIGAAAGCLTWRDWCEGRRE